MYLTISQTAEYLHLDVSEIVRLIREKQIRYVRVDDDILIYKEQFNLFLKERERYLKEYQDYLNTPLPDDIDIKDED
ncbi:MULTISPECIES: helix-turn-helix domain-containing protein [unclassified Granulicatella]|uniref:helix-turn-helix domain-containing protein n=1 Tax=unclassified Granulicatella TaxID=2630493 RepID=UPI0010732904|nr:MULTISPECIES: helix-turn-helix domain-containing protein [unclassified Granulicatella]MBF0780223.1 helix-turn-helix domain-containing protein [Granulicatella sp. 19428wC4_WM01]TFU95657.1 DNA-binding protein [Granulicatella sp. WM01]